MAAMAIPRLNLHHLYTSGISPNISHSTTNKVRLPLQISITFPRNSNRFSGQKFAFVQKMPASNISEGLLDEDGDDRVKFSVILGKWVNAIRSVLPGGNWWNLCDHEEVASTATGSVSAMFVLRRMWVLLDKDRWVIYVAFGSLIVAALSEISIPSLLAASIFSAQSGDTVVLSNNIRILVLLCFTSGICSGARSGCFAIANLILVKRLKETLYSAVICQDICFFDTEAVGDLTSRLGSDCQKLSHVIGNDINLISRNILQGAGALINMLTLSWPLALSALVICSILSTVFLVYGQYQKEAARLTQDITACVNEVAQETFSLMRTVRVSGTESKEIKRYKKWLEKLAFISARESVAYGFWSMSFNTLYRSTQVFALLLGGMSILTGHTSPEQLTKYVLYCEWLIYATWRVGDNMSTFLQSVGASEKVFRLMDLLPSDQFSSKGVKLQRLIGNIEFVDVSFCYASRTTVPVLENVNFSVRANEVVAIVGTSGSGKSTQVNLLLRLYDPTRGQEPHLFHMDVKSNIAYGCSRDIEQGDIEWAAKQANAHEFITSLPNGYDTLIDDGLLSGGQKQRIVIARAFLRDPIILILDEANSALDAESECYVTSVLHAFRNDPKSNKTVIIIAHRLSTVKAADRIIVMDRGRVVEMGNHMDLILNNKLYARFIKVQTDASASS